MLVTLIDASFHGYDHILVKDTDHDDPLFGGKTKAEYSKLFVRIVEYAPAPFGLGLNHKR